MLAWESGERVVDGLPHRHLAAARLRKGELLGLMWDRVDMTRGVHHFASWYIMRDGSLPALQQILGHGTLAMTMCYSHLAPKHLHDEMARTERTEATMGRAQARAQEAVSEEALLQK